MYQTHTHEISGRPVVDANKYALQVLDRTACKHLGIQNQERPLIGVRGQRKDMGRGLFLFSFPPPFPPSVPFPPPLPCLCDCARTIWAEVSVFPACGCVGV
jgi:hypothetical protein